MNLLLLDEIIQPVYTVAVSFSRSLVLSLDALFWIPQEN